VDGRLYGKQSRMHYEFGQSLAAASIVLKVLGDDCSAWNPVWRCKAHAWGFSATRGEVT
jgi:hypothetical protein